MSAASQPYSDAQKAMMEKFNAHIREGSSSFAAPAGSADECGACETYRKAWILQLQRADILEHALNEIRLLTHDVGALARAEDALKRSLPNDGTHRREAAVGDVEMQTRAATAASRSVQ